MKKNVNYLIDNFYIGYMLKWKYFIYIAAILFKPLYLIIFTVLDVGTRKLRITNWLIFFWDNT